MSIMNGIGFTYIIDGRYTIGKNCNCMETKESIKIAKVF